MDAIQKSLKRFNEKTIKGDGCWRWLGVFTVHGFAAHYIGRRPIQAHLFAYEQFIGPRPRARLMHTCGNRGCVNPHHLALQAQPIERRFWAKVQKTDGCWLWTGYKNRLGYGRINVGGRIGPTQATRASWFIHTGQWPPRGAHLCHTCDNPPCVNPAHLYVGDDKTNADDREARGRGNQPRNLRNGKCKWSPEVVNTVRELRKTLTIREVSAATGVPMGTIGAFMMRTRRRYCQ